MSDFAVVVDNDRAKPASTTTMLGPLPNSHPYTLMQVFERTDTHATRQDQEIK
jgi:hypothetical protein